MANLQRIGGHVKRRILTRTRGTRKLFRKKCLVAYSEVADEVTKVSAECHADTLLQKGFVVPES